VYKNQQSRQTGSRNLMGPKTLPTIWHTYMKLVTKYQIPVINSCLEKCDEKCGWTHQIPASCMPTLLIFIHIEHICSFFITFFSATIDGRNLIFGHKFHIGTRYRGKRFWIHQIPSFCLLIMLIFIHIEHTFVYTHFSSHFYKQLVMTGIWYLGTSFI
jgi:hypothetical protein